MRLAVVSPFLDRRHGTERALCEVLERLARDYPCEVHLFAQSVADLAVRAPESAASSPARILWHRVPSIRGPHLLQFLFWYFRNRAVRRAASRRAGLPFDLVLSPGVNCADANVILVHVLFHRLRELSRESAAQSTPALQKIHQSLYYRLLSWLETGIYKNPAVRLAAVSPRTRADLQRYFSRADVSLIPNAVDTEAFSPVHRLARRAALRLKFNLAENEFVLLLIGNDWRVKGLPAVLEALALLPDLPLRLLVVGDVGASAQPFRDLAGSLGVLPRCLWMPPHGDVLSFYAAADLYLSPTLEDSFAFPVAEAMACGLPAITSQYAGISAYLTDGVDAFVQSDPRDAQALAQRIRELHANPVLAKNLADSAATKAREWTWDRNAAQVWALLQPALSKI